MHDERGNIEIGRDELLGTVDSAAVFMQFAVGVSMSLFPLEPLQIDAAGREFYEEGMACMHDWSRAATGFEQP